jgi:D-alanine-D-alanine ligase
MTTIWAVVFGGPSPEHEISILTGLQAERVLLEGGHRVSALYQAPTGAWYMVPARSEAKDFLTGAPAGSTELEIVLSGKPGIYAKKGMGKKALEIEAALLCFHGGLGEGGGAAALFSFLDIPATGSSVYAGAVGMDKLAFGGLMQVSRIATLPREALLESRDPSFPGPYIVKPRFGGSSIGIEIVDDIVTARTIQKTSVHLQAGAVVEPYRGDLVDLNISFRTYPGLELTDLERPLRGDNDAAGVYSYQEKYLAGAQDGAGAGLTHAPRELPAQAPDSVHKRAQELATAVAEVTRLRGIVRVDLLWDQKTNEVFVNEVNTIPGALSLYLWAPKHQALTVLVDALIEARDHPVVFPSSGFGQGVALRAAGGIAGKLVGLDGPRG